MLQRPDALEVRKAAGWGWWIGALVIIVIAASRFWLAATVPLTDTTEARFGEIARKMVETSDWLVPQHDYGVPYLAKPPLAFWLSAIGIETFGAGEIGPRIAILVVALAFCALFFFSTKRLLGAAAAAAGLVILMTSLVFFIAMAAVMTDMVLTVCTASALIAFWRRLHGDAGGWELSMYVATGLGLLAKGPLALVLILAPIVAFGIATGRRREVWRRFAWLKGAALVCAVAAPWYVAAQLRNPGFLDYFLIGEHVGRFLTPGWSGDLYGRAHDAPRGAIWVFLLIGMLPWSLFFAPMLFTARGVLRRSRSEHRELLLFLLAWALTPLVLFTFSAHVIFPYVLPAVPPIAMALAALRSAPSDDAGALLRLSSVGVVAIAAIVGLAAIGPQVIERHTQRPVIAAVRLRHQQADWRIYYWRSRSFSADYYSAGATATLDGPASLARILDRRHSFSLLVAEDRTAEIPAAMARQLERVTSVGGYSVFEPRYAVSAAAQAPGRVR